MQACTYMWQQHGTWASQRSGTAACGNSTLVGSRTSKRAAADGSPPQATAPVPSPRVPAHAAAAHPRHTASGARLHWVGFMVHWRQGPSNRARFPADKPCRQMQAQPASASRPRSSPSITAAGTACSPSALNCLVPDGACAAANDAKRSWAAARTGGAGAAVLQQPAAAAAVRRRRRPGCSCWRCRARVACGSSSSQWQPEAVEAAAWLLRAAGVAQPAPRLQSRQAGPPSPDVPIAPRAGS